jgi:hypothetical protein
MRFVNRVSSIAELHLGEILPLQFSTLFTLCTYLLYLFIFAGASKWGTSVKAVEK